MTSRTSHRLLDVRWFGVTFGVAAVAYACSNAPVADDRFVVHAPPSSQFVNQGVGEFLEARCGTLDCHGTMQRNLKLYGKEGLRIDSRTDPNDPLPLPGAPLQSSIQELTADYHSLVGLEPELLTAVVRDGGAHPERLTFVRKARGTESHKGNQLWNEGDDSDLCVTSWLTGTTNVDACTRALAAVDPQAATP